MKWQGRKGSSNVEDRRGSGGPGGMIPIGGGLGLVLMIIFALFGNPFSSTEAPRQDQGYTNPDSSYTVEESKREEEIREFTAVVLKDLEDVWTSQLDQTKVSFTPATLVLYRGQTRTGCGLGLSQSGPFYCPADQKIYLDLSFADQLEQKLGAKGDFALAYVLAHEMGHHIQTLTGVTNQVMPLRDQMSEREFNQYLMRFELQADYLAGVYAKSVEGKGYLDPGDIEEAMNAAAAVGDDTLQKRAQGYANPDTFTHGSSAQRMEWFRRGYAAGDLSDWNTFKN